MVCTARSIPVPPRYLSRCAQPRPDAEPQFQQREQHIQRAVRSVCIMSTLRQDLLATEHVPNGLDSISRYQYCEALAAAIASDDDSDNQFPLLTLVDAIQLGLQWGLFDLVHKLATSMDSEDHSAVMPVLQALAAVVCDGAFRDVMCFEESSTAEKPYDDAVLDRMIQACDGSIPTKGMLLGHLKYYLQYMYAVSPTEGRVFIEVSQLIHELEDYVDGQQNGASVDNGDVVVAIQPEPTPVTDTSCILCKYNVSGHVHPGVSAKVTPVRPDYLSSTLAKPVAAKCFFGATGSPRSPAYREMDKFLIKLEREYDNFTRTIDVETFRHTNTPRKFTVSDLYDAIGAAHDPPKKHRSPAASTQRTELLNVMNDILLDTSCMVSSAQLVALHKCLLPTSSGQGGVIRTDSAVGYASSRIYRVFLPASEISAALQSFVQAINRWKQRPLLCAYYAFAVLVFYIHPFHDGNGRCARILGNVVAKKLGYRPILRASDKTLQVEEFAQRTVVAHQATTGSPRG